MKKILLFLIPILIFNSCATILNSDTTRVKISSDKESKIIFDKDTLKINSGKTKIYPIRSKQDLKITVLKDSLEKDFYFKRKVSKVIYLNYYNYGLGLLVDLWSDKRFTYRKNLHFTTDSIANKIVLSKKKINYFSKNTFFLYTSPLQFIDPFSVQIPTLGGEYFFNKNISLSAEYGFSDSPFYNRNKSSKVFKERAETYRFETKLYNKLILTNNVHLNEYIGLEYRKVKSQYDDDISYFSTNDNSERDFINDSFGTKKTVSIINLKYGIILPLDNHFYFDFYTGFGVRTKKYNHTGLEYDRSIHTRNFRDELFFSSYRDFRDYTKKSFLNYSLGFKFGYKF